MNTAIPRTDVGGGVLTGAVVTLLLLAQHDTIFEFDAVSGAIGVVLIGIAGYMPRRYKSFIMATAAVLAALIASLLGWAFFDSPFDANIVSFNLACFIVAAGGYILPARNPDAVPTVVEVDPAMAEGLARGSHPHRH